MSVYMGISRYRSHIERERWAEVGAIRGHDVSRMKIPWQGCVLLGFPRWNKLFSGWAGLALHRGVLQVWILSSVYIILFYDAIEISYCHLSFFFFFFSQFLFSLLYLHNFSAFTPGIFSPGLCSHVLTLPGISFSQSVSKANLPAFFFPFLLYLCVPSFCFPAILSVLIRLHLGLCYSFLLIMTGVELSTLPAFSLHPHQLL